MQERKPTQIVITKEDEIDFLKIEEKVQQLGESQGIRQTRSVDHLTVNL